MRHRLTTADWILMGACVCLILACYVLANATMAQGSTVLIQVDGSTIYKTLLSDAHSTVVHGVLGALTIEVRDGKVAVTAADCPNHICVKTGWRSRAGEAIVCVPNKTVVRITGDQRGVRAITG